MAALQGLLERCRDYFELVTGAAPDHSAAGHLLASLPPGKAPDDKLVIGLWRDSENLVGVLDAVRNYPKPGEWFVGLLLLDPAQRGQGLGRQVYQGFEAWAAGLGARRIGLGVVEQNEGAFRFWQRLGFAVVEMRSPTHIGQRESRIIVMTRPLQGAL